MPGVVAAHAQCRDPDGDRSRCVRQDRRCEEALSKVIADHPNDTEAITALGNIQRERKDFATCGTTYSKAIDTIPTPGKSNWVLFYFRGICYERANQWPKAEADMQKALALYPDQPLVLNYLGYSSDRQRHAPRPGHGHDPPRGRAAAR